MFQEFRIAMAIHAELDAERNSAKLIEGMTVEVLSIVDRIMLAIRSSLASRRGKAHETPVALAQASSR